jgi:hypothetical protein
MLNKRNLAITAVLAAPAMLGSLLLLTGSGSLQFASLLLAIGCIAITVANWHAHHGGRNPSFIFLALGCIFFAGRAFPVLFGGDSQIARIEFENVFDINVDTVIAFVPLVLTSFLLVHIGSLLPRVPGPKLSVSTVDARIYLGIFIALLPVYLYKNVYYFNYMMAHGGYLAIYRGTEHLEGIGTTVRLGALLCLAAFTLYFFHEADQKKSRRALIIFLVVFASELLVGLRGKFFVVSLVLFLFYKLRFGGKFSARGLLTLVVAVIIISAVVAAFREQMDAGALLYLLVMFLSQQGVTAGVNLVVMEGLPYFLPNAGSYFWHQFAAPFYTQLDVPEGWFLANDISMLIMPNAYLLGFGTASSYLAELLLLGGWVGVGMGSLVIGWVLSSLRRFNQGVIGALMFWVACGIVYYPRTMLHEPVHNLMRYGAPILLIAGVCWLVRRGKSKTRR